MLVLKKNSWNEKAFLKQLHIKLNCSFVNESKVLVGFVLDGSSLGLTNHVERCTSN